MEQHAAQTTLLPYEDLSIAWDDDRSGFELSAPWITMRVDVDPTERNTLYETTQLLKEHTSPQAQVRVSDFLHHFSKYPLAYAAPRKQLSPEQHLCCLCDNAQTADHNSSPLLFLHRLHITMPINIEQTLANWSFDWPMENILARCRINSASPATLYDPLSLYTHLRRRMLMIETASTDDDSALNLLNHLRVTDEPAFFSAMALTIRQNHYITQRCIECLTPALTAYAPAHEAVRAYIQEEAGHDKLLQRSLESLGVPIDSIPIFPETQLSMEILKSAAQHHFLAFSCLVGAFEGSAYREEDAFGALLRASSKPEAAAGIDKHFAINTEGNHAAIGEAFARTIGPVCHADALIAIRLTEIIVKIGPSIFQRIVQHIRASA